MSCNFITAIQEWQKLQPQGWQQALSLLQEVVQRPSISPDDQGCQTELLHAYLTQAGFVAIPCTKPNSKGRLTTNTFYVYCNQPARQQQLLEQLTQTGDLQNFTHKFLPPVSFCFAGHTDVVPHGSLADWKYPPYAATFSQDGHEVALADLVTQLQEQLNSATPEDFDTTATRTKFSGRGAADMKTGLVASAVAAQLMITQLQAEQLEGLPQDYAVCLLVTSDEEAEALVGTKLVVEELARLGETLSWCLVAEPSCEKFFGDAIQIGSRGDAGLFLTIHGKGGHVAYPHQVTNPIHLASNLIAEFAQHYELDPGNNEFPPSTMHVVNLHAGDGTTNLVPNSCRLTLNIRYNTNFTYESLIAHLRQMIAQHLPEDSYTISTECSGNCFVCLPHEPIVAHTCAAITHYIPTLHQRAVQAQTTPSEQIKLSTEGGTSDARFIINICPQILSFGVIGTTCHQVDEHTYVDQYLKSIMIYQDTLIRCLQDSARA